MHCILGVVFHTQKRRFYNLLHTDAFYTLLHTGTFTPRSFHTQRFYTAAARFYTQTLLRTDAFTQRFCTQTLLHTDAFTQAFTQRDAFTHRSFCMLSHTNALTHRHGDTQMILRTETFTHRHVCARGYCGGSKLAILPQSLAIEPHFARKGCGGSCEIVMFLATEPHFVRKGCRGHFKIANLFQSL